jgi:uncharacterized protein with LGFP repeats
VGRLGFPLADEEEVTSSLGTTGIRQHFEGGERDGLPAGDQWEFSQGVWVYSSTHGTYPVWGGPHIYYDTNGQHQSALGFPVDKERQATPSPQKTEGWYQEFEGGNIHWTAKYGSVPVIGAIHDLYRSLGGSGGNFGFPTDPEESVEGQPNMRMQQFEGGALCIVTT